MDNRVSLAHFDSLNQRMSALVMAKIQAVFGTEEERTVMRGITQRGIEGGEALIKLIEEGLTYEIWKAFLDGVNAPDGPLKDFENESGEMAALLNDYCAADLRGAYEEIQELDHFKVDTIRQDLEQLKQRLAFAEQMWSNNDKMDEATESLKAVVTPPVVAE